MTDQTPTAPEFHGLTRRQPKLWLAMIQQAEQDNAVFDADTAEIEAQIRQGRSVVLTSHKKRYNSQALAKGHTSKAKRRSCNDWLSNQMQRLTLDDEQKLIVPAFEAILDANGVKHAHWNRVTPGWQGRLRMTGGIALRTKVADAAQLVLPNGQTLEAPLGWLMEYMGR